MIDAVAEIGGVFIGIALIGLLFGVIAMYVSNGEARPENMQKMLSFRPENMQKNVIFLESVSLLSSCVSDVSFASVLLV